MRHGARRNSEDVGRQCAHVIMWCLVCVMMRRAGGECEVHSRHSASKNIGQLKQQKARDREGKRWTRPGLCHMFGVCLFLLCVGFCCVSSLQHRAYAKIEKENRLLLERLSKAMQEKNIDNVNVKASRFRRSLMQTQRKLELQRITQENQVRSMLVENNRRPI